MCTIFNFPTQFLMIYKVLDNISLLSKTRIIIFMILHM